MRNNTSGGFAVMYFRTFINFSEATFADVLEKMERVPRQNWHFRRGAREVLRIRRVFVRQQ